MKNLPFFFSNHSFSFFQKTINHFWFLVFLFFLLGFGNYPYFFSGVASLDGGITIGINTDSTFNGQSPEYFLANINQNCEVVWEQEYDSSYQNYALQLAASDGGYILTEVESSNLYNFLKVNSVGLLEPSCDTVSTQLPDLFVQNLNVFNNGIVFQPSEYAVFEVDFARKKLIHELVFYSTDDFLYAVPLGL